MGKRIPKHIGAGENERVRVSVLKRRKSIEEYRGARIRNAVRSHQIAKPGLVAKGKMAGTKTQRLRPAKEYLINNLRREHLERKVNIRAKHIETAKLASPTDGSPVLLIRIRGNQDVSKPAKLLLEKYRLGKLHDAVMVTGTSEVARDAHILKDYVAAGQPTEEHVRELVKHMARYKDAKGTIHYLTGNSAVEQYLGQYGVICVEDVVDTLLRGAAAGPCFEPVSQWLLPFNLAPPAHQENRDVERSLYTKREMLSKRSMAAYLAGAITRKNEEKGTEPV